MTTICVDLGTGVIVSDTRVTRDVRREVTIFNLLTIPISRMKTTQWDCTQKALYLHDGVLFGAGDVDNISRIINIFTREKVDLSDDDMTTCYIRKNYYIIWNMYKGKLIKKVYFYNKKDGGRLYFGSGSKWLQRLVSRTKGDLWDIIISYIFVKQLDKYTNDRINLHYI